MSKGFYDLTSSMLTQSRHLGVISNNISNAATPGFKSDEFIDTTFQEEMFSRYGNIDHEGTELGTTTSMITAGIETVTDYTQGGIEETGNLFDFALISPGFFQVQSEESGIQYTRNGSFILDDEGYLSLPHGGRVLGEDGNPIAVGTDDIQVLGDGTILSADGNMEYGKLGIVDFADYTTLQKSKEEGLFTTNGGQPMPTDASIQWQTIEKSNVNLVKEMSDMLESQRTLQSAAQVLKMYDQMMGKAATEIGRV